MFCKNCGTKLGESVQFCQSCGKSTSHSGGEDIKNVSTQSFDIIKCGSCNHIGQGEPNRRLISKILAWMCVIFAPLITIIYFVATPKYRCPKCKSTFLGVKNKDGVFVNEKTGAVKVLLIIVYIFVGIAVIGLLSTIIAAPIQKAREKGREARENAIQIQEQNTNTLNAQ
jgi:RNA polymerase subunit RPABC4/transcription elongation factor Spt4